MRQLDGRLAVVTGASNGIGRAIARALTAAGTGVVAADIVAPEGLGCDFVRTDVGDAASVSALADAIGTPQILVANAGVGGVYAPLWEHTLEDWETTLRVNLFGIVHVLRAFLPAMLASGAEGHVVITASIAGVISTPSMAAYNASKHAAVTIAETLHHDLESASAPIGVTVVCPGPVATAIGDAMRAPFDLGAVLREHGIAPEAVADDVVAAIRESRFYVFTHPAMLRHVRRRVDAMETGGPPARPAGFDSY